MRISGAASWSRSVAATDLAQAISGQARASWFEEIRRAVPRKLATYWREKVNGGSSHQCEADLT